MLGLFAAAVLLTARTTFAAEEKKADVPPTAGEGWTVLFNGKDLTGWTLREAKNTGTWKVTSSIALDAADPKSLTGAGDGGAADAALFRQPIKHGCDIFTEKAWGDCELHVEFIVPKGSNSGVYLMGQYEVQVMDSFGKEKVGPGDVGAIYNVKAPTENAAKAPGEWQSFDIVFRAPRFKDGKKVENALFVNVKLNGKTIHENVEAPKPTGSQLPGGEKETGPLMFQGDHGIVAFRNVRVKPIALREPK